MIVYRRVIANNFHLVGGDWNMNFMTSPTRLGMMIQSDELIFFRGVETTN